MKKIINLFCCLGLVLLTGCDMLGGSDFDYADFALAVSSPSGSTAAKYEGKSIEFAVMISSEPFVMESEGEDIDGDQYVWAAISRDFQNHILLNVQDVKDVPGIYETVIVRGKVDGYLYSTDEGGKEEALNINVSEFKKIETEDVKVEEGATYTMSDGTKVTFTRAQITSDAFGDTVAVIYYDIKMGDSIVGSSFLQELELYQGDVMLNTSIFPTNAEIDPSAMEASYNGLKEGEKAFIYSMYGGLVDSTTPISITAYDDEFNLVYHHKLSLEE